MCSPVIETHTLGLHRVLLMQDPPSLRTVKPCVSYLILGVAAMTGPKCGLAPGWRECKLGGLLMNFHLRRQVQTTYHWETIVVGDPPRLSVLPGQQARKPFWFGSPVAKAFELTPDPAS